MTTTTPSTSPRRAARAAKPTRLCWISAFTQGQRPLKMREQRTVFPEPQTRISLDTHSLILTWTWMTTQIMNSASDVQLRRPLSAVAATRRGSVRFSRWKSVWAGGDLRAWHSSHELAGLQQPYFFFVQTQHRTIQLAPFQTNRQKKEILLAWFLNPTFVFIRKLTPWGRPGARAGFPQILYVDPLQPEGLVVRWILEHPSYTRVWSNERCHQRKCRGWIFYAACLLCVYCMLRCKSNKIHRYSVNTYYVQSTVVGANQYKSFSKPCWWLAVWFQATLLILVCLIAPTSKVGITTLAAFLPHRGVVRIQVVTFGALNLLEEVWYKHILFFIVLHTFEYLRAKQFTFRP